MAGFYYTVRIVINKNDGSGASYEISDSGYVGGAAFIDLYLRDTETYTRPGYDFSHYLTSTGSARYYPGGKVTFYVTNGSPQTIYLDCQWTPATYTISYNVGGGSGAPESQTKKHGTDITLSTAAPSWAGHDFVEWNTAADGSGNGYQPGDTFSEDGDTTLHAIWNAHTYTVTFNANGGSSAPAPMTKTHGEPLQLTADLPVKSLYRFVAWNTAADGSGTGYQPGDTYYGNEAVTLYAVWVRETYTITYDANGYGVAPAQQTKDSGDSVTIAPAITTVGSLMIEWNTAADGTGTGYDPGDTYSADADLTLYAIWTVAEFTVTFDADGGSVSPATKQVLWGAKYGTLPTPTKPGGTFYGWFIGDLLVTANSIVEILEDTTLTAAWSIRSSMRVKGSDGQMHTGALYVKGSDGQMHMAIAYVKGSDGQMHVNG